MKAGTFFLAAINDVFRGLTPETKETLAIFGGLFVVLLVIVVWILCFRKPSSRHHHHPRSRSRSAQRNETQEPAQPVVRKRRVRRSKYRQRPFNPTLAQTRGLPPLRDERQQSTSQFSS
jgi:hypothetical protein